MQKINGTLCQFISQYENNNVTWCTVSKAEQDKCMAFKQAVERDRGHFGPYYISLECKQAFNKEECMTMLDLEKAHLTTLDPGEVFTAGRYHSLVPFMQERYTNNSINYQYAVAVIKKGSLPDVTSLYNLRGKKACFAGVGTLAGWTIPLDVLMRQGGLEVIDCNNHVKSTINYFGPSCAVNSLMDHYNPLGDNSDQLCKLCIGKIPGGWCTNDDPYAGYEGAFRCLLEAGEIAFLVHTTVSEMTSTNFDLNSVTKDQFELLCRNGTRGRIDDFESCNWGKVPSRAIVTSSARDFQTLQLYSKFLENAVLLFGKNNYANNGTDPYDNRRGYGDNRPTFEDHNYENGYGTRNDNWNNENAFDDEYRENNDRESTQEPSYNAHGYDFSDDKNRGENPSYIQPIETFHMFESAPKFGLHHNLLFSDTATGFLKIKQPDQTYEKFLGRALDTIMAVRRCPVPSVTLCVTSDPEMEKCKKMKIAMRAQLLQPELFCHKAHSQINCMQAIQNGNADITVLDASDVYTAGLRFGQVPIMSEVYNLGTPDYYVVAVAKESDEKTELTYLKNKYTCHTGINTAAGWIYPLAYLLSNGWIRGYGCDSVRAAAEYFTKSCIPGALSLEYNTGVPYDNMCDLCHGVTYRYCRRDASEDYYGHTGAFRCLVEGGGDVAFVKHTTVNENTNGKRKEFWARNTFTKDFELLCPDGTRRPSWDYPNCNIGKVKANAMIARGGYYGYNQTEINSYINLFTYAEQFYGRKYEDEFSFSMFSSAPPYSDLIFQDATQQLIAIPHEQREYSAYLGPDFMRARRIVDCDAGASALELSLITVLTTLLLTLNSFR
ncbi:melanotransferrin isoform X2 [Venturia canescens]|uniref:melanotransferrin isoform X2 n=1 Tax=Venturia canescens TaxID=32260 RepID=UPI001C9C7CCB|nr:melanotransferrin isoform X2 [Venturia canescens]